RIRALARRSHPALPPTLVHGDLRLDSARRVATRAGRPLALSPKEFAVLELLLGAQGAVVSAEEILERVWDEFADPFTTAVKTTISRLRSKLGDPPVIETVAQPGYRIGPCRVPFPAGSPGWLSGPTCPGAPSACASPPSTAGSSSPRAPCCWRSPTFWCRTRPPANAPTAGRASPSAVPRAGRTAGRLRAARRQDAYTPGRGPCRPSPPGRPMPSPPASPPTR